jgi:hypothetical protein
VDLSAECVNDPLRWALTFFPWGEGALQGKKLDKWQIDWLKSWRDALQSGQQTSIRQATKSGHGVGKTVIVSIAMLFCMSTRPMFNGVCTAGTETQLKSKTWRELNIWKDRAINGHFFEWTKTRLSHVAAPEKWAINAIPWSDSNPDAFAGLHGDHVGLFFDEASSIVPIIWETCEGAMTTPNSMWFAFGNPTTPNGRFYDCFHKDYKRWRAFTVNSEESLYVNPSELEAMAEFYGRDSDQYRVRVLGEFPQGGSLLMYPRDLILSAVNREIFRDGGQPLVMAVDVARKGDDLSGFGFRQGLWFGDLYLTGEEDIMMFADEVHEAAIKTRPRHICVDAVGVGGGVYDRLKQLGHDNLIEINGGARAKNPMRHLNKAAELYDVDVREHLRRGSIPNDQKLIDDLCSIEKGAPRDGKHGDVTRLKPKRELDFSTDASDIFAYTYGGNFIPVDYERKMLIDVAYKQKTSSGLNFDPFNF